MFLKETIKHFWLVNKWFILLAANIAWFSFWYGVVKVDNVFFHVLIWFFNPYTVHAFYILWNNREGLHTAYIMAGAMFKQRKVKKK